MIIELFSERLYELLGGIAADVQNTIKSIDLSDIDNINVIANDIYHSNHLTPIAILDTTRRVENREVPLYDYLHQRWFEAERDVYCFKVSFRGTWKLLEYHGFTSRYEEVEANVSEDYLEFEVINEHNDLKAVSKEYRSVMDWIEWNINIVNNEVEDFNSSLSGSIVSGIKSRIDYLTKRNIEEDELGLPPLESDGGPIDIPIVIEPPLELYFEPFEFSSERQYRIGDRVFDNLMAAIYRTAHSMEQHPSSFDLDEESLRDHILSLVEGWSSLHGTGESFNGAGKTDILFTYREHNVFIGECKIWKGIAYVSEGLDQLESYLSWDDTKASLIVFYKNKSDTTTAIDELDSSIRSRYNYVKMVKESDRGHRYEMTHPRDSSRKYILETCFFDLSPVD
jgi:hypothetical protein